MPEEVFIHTDNELKQSEDYDFLRREGIRLIQLLSGNVWTDYNAHDPGITLLEALCYALTDLGYRTSFDIKDIITSENSENDATGLFHTARQVLPSNPVTITDFRKLVIDVEGVRNAWVEPSADYEHLMYLRTVAVTAGAQAPSVEIGFDPGDDGVPLRLSGLYKITVDYEDDIQEENRQQEVNDVIRKKLNIHRNLCEDFLSIRPVEFESFRMDAVVQVKEGSDIERINARIFQVIHDFFSPSIRFYTWEQMEAKGYSAEEILEGPSLKNGFIDSVELEKSEKYMDIHLSDIINLLTDIPGVIAIKKCTFPVESQSAFSDFTQWITNIKEKEKVPKLDVENSTVHFVRSGDRHRSDNEKQPDSERVKAIYNFMKTEHPSSKLKDAGGDIAVPSGEFMNVSAYYPFQFSLPSCYGMQERIIDSVLRSSVVGELLDELANFQTEERGTLSAEVQSLVANRMQTRDISRSDLLSVLKTAPGKFFILNRLPVSSRLILQLRGFLMVFEQIMADYLSQLDNLPELFSFDPDKTHVFFPSVLSEIKDTELLFSDLKNYADNLPVITENEMVRIKSKNAILDHLLARVGEDWSTYATKTKPASKKSKSLEMRSKAEFLMKYSQVSSYKGAGFDYSNSDQVWGSGNIAGMKRRICMLLGMQPEETATIAKDWISVQPSVRSDKLPLFKVVLRDPSSGKTLLESNDFDEIEVGKVLKYILENGYNKNLYDPDEHTGRFNYKLKIRNKEGWQFVAYHNENDSASMKISFDKTLDALLHLAQVENFHVLEHILLRPKANPQLAGGQQKPVSLLNIYNVPDQVSSGGQTAVASPYNFKISTVPDPADPNEQVFQLTLRQGRDDVLAASENFQFQENVRKRMEHLRNAGTNNANYIRIINDDNRSEFSIHDGPNVLAASVHSYQKAEDMEHVITSLIDYFSYELKLVNEDDPEALDLSAYADPYSFHISIFVPEWPLRFRDPGFRHLFEKAVYLETPAHVYPELYWLSFDEMRDFEAVYKSWLKEISANVIPDTDIVNNLVDMVNKIRSKHRD